MDMMDTLEGRLAWMRNNGWMVAIHNDYMQNGKQFAFWLFTRKCGTDCGEFVKGESQFSDKEAIGLCIDKARSLDAD